MSTPARLLLFGIGLVVIFGVTFFAGRALVPEETVTNWVSEAQESGSNHAKPNGHGNEPEAHGADVTRGHQGEPPVEVRAK